MRFRVTITGEYEGDPTHYGDLDDPADMAAIDEESFTADPYFAISAFDSEPEVAVVPVEDRA